VARPGGRFRERARRATAGFATRLEEMALAMPQMCCSLYLMAGGCPRQVGGFCIPVARIASLGCFLPLSCCGCFEGGCALAPPGGGGATHWHDPLA
jgi:hypothetical protein